MAKNTATCSNTSYMNESMDEYTNLTPDGDDEILMERPFKDSHHLLIRAIWNVERFNPKVDDKLAELRVLFANGYSPNIVCDVLHDVTGQPIAQATPLLIACFEGDADVIKLIINEGIDVNQTESEHHLTALHVICDAEFRGQNLRQKDRSDIVKMLIEENANVNHLDRNYMAAIHKAVIHDRPDCVKELMEAKADPNVIYMGDTPLSIAARNNRDRICRLLLSYRETNVNHRNDQGGTPLHYSCAAIVDSPYCVELLVAAGAKINVQDHKKNTPAMVAAFFGKPRILQFLIEKGVDLSLRNNEDKDAYEIAEEKEHSECRSIILHALERIENYRKPAKQLPNYIETKLAKNFETKTRISKF